ncbi:MAG: indolepyruvate ferredoxin oxidoreductase subunit alpha [Euryarchaeota archaeon]|nr:indolepyruvate ferredoxin oxidoreductase subunit alpha [Euryarchaeota archaeon]
MRQAYRKYLLGNEAIAQGILESGVSLVAGYPGTPSSEIIPIIAQNAESYEQPLHVEWSVNEKVAVEVAAGAAYCNKRAAVTMKHVGLNVAADPFMTLAYTGVTGGLVLIVVDDPGCHSSQNEQDSRRYAQFAKIPCLDPSTPQEAYELTKYAFNLSEMFEIPVMLRPTTRVSHARATVTTTGITHAQRPAAFSNNPKRWVMIPKHARGRHVHLNALQPQLRAELALLNQLKLGRSKLGVVTGGVSAKYVEEAVKRLKLRSSVLKVTAYPIEEGLIKTLAENVARILVIEELEPVIEEQVLAAAPSVHVYGKHTGHVPRESELTVDRVMHSFETLLGRSTDIDIPVALSAVEDTLPPRPPVLCAGCPHRATFYALRKVFKNEAVYLGDIGCYTLGVYLRTIDTTLCMGASIGMSGGFSEVCDRKVISIIGDSTFIHTGVPALINAVYNGANVVLVILDNGTTAMTGHQPHPCTGITATGSATFPTPMEELITAIGVNNLQVVDPYNVFETEEAFGNAKKGEGVQVIIARRPCVITAKKAGTLLAMNRRDSSACENCQLCNKLFCPAMSYGEEGASISEDCVGCGLCEHGRAYHCHRRQQTAT